MTCPGDEEHAPQPNKKADESVHPPHSCSSTHFVQIRGTLSSVLSVFIPVLGGFSPRFFRQILPRFVRHFRSFCYHHDARRRYMVELFVFLMVITDLTARRNRYILVDDGLPDATVSADVHILHEDRIVHLTVAVHAYVRRQHRVLHPTAAH